MSRAHLERRLAALERQPVADPGVRIVTLAPGEPMPDARPGEVLIINDISRLVAVQEGL